MSTFQRDTLTALVTELLSEMIRGYGGFELPRNQGANREIWNAVSKVTDTDIVSSFVHTKRCADEFFDTLAHLAVRLPWEEFWELLENRETIPTGRIVMVCHGDIPTSMRTHKHAIIGIGTLRGNLFFAKTSDCRTGHVSSIQLMQLGNIDEPARSDEGCELQKELEGRNISKLSVDDMRECVNRMNRPQPTLEVDRSMTFTNASMQYSIETPEERAARESTDVVHSPGTHMRGDLPDTPPAE